MNQNYNYANLNNPVSVAPASPTTTDNSSMKLGMYILMAFVVIGCFFPYITIDAFGVKDSINYIYEKGEVLNGIYLIIMVILAFTQTLKGNYNKAIPFLGIALGIFVYNWIDLQSTINELGIYKEYVSYGIGFWMIVIGTIGSLVLCCLLNKANPAPTNVNLGVTVTNATNVYQQPQPMPNQYAIPQQVTKCSYCGMPKNEGMFCKSCGGKY